MDFWNKRNMLAPPTYTYKANVDDIDISHFKSILEDGISFYNDQNAFSAELALLSRIVYRMKTKFRNSKDFHMLEKVKKVLIMYEEIDISRKLKYLLSILPNFTYLDVIVSLPTKNMIDFILVQLQGIGKVLCRAIDACKNTFILYEHRLYLGHFWKMALIAIALVSRIHILSLNIVKFTCHLYVRLLPFSHKLKNTTINWLPKEYVFPKDLKTWLDVEWCKLEEPIEIADEYFNMNFIDLADDSDDDVQFVGFNDVIEIVEDFRKIQKSQVKSRKYDSVTACPTDDIIDIGEEVTISEDEIEIENHDGNPQNKDDQTANTDEDMGEEMGPPEAIPPLKASCSVHSTQNETTDLVEICDTEIDIGEIISSDDEVAEETNKAAGRKSKKAKKGNSKKKNSSMSQVIISSSEDEDDASVQFIGETAKSRKPCVTSDFIPLVASTPQVNKMPVNFQTLSGKKKKNKKNNKNASVIVIPDTPKTVTANNSMNQGKRSALKRKLKIGNENNVRPKKKKKNFLSL